MPVLLAGPPREAVAWKADGVHGRSPHRAVRPLLRSAPAHHRAELLAARRAGADLILVSPIFPTRSHPGAPALGAVKAGLMIGPDRRDIVALGGITHARGRAMQRMGIQRWAAIDGLAAKPPGDQKRKAVPI
jgi:thiamine-phosphate pyrophosphorylase